MAVDELVAQVRHVVSSLPTAVLEQAAGLLSEARQVLEQVAIGSSSGELQSAAAGLAESLQNVTAVRELVGRAASTLTAYVGTLGVAEPSPPAPTAPQAAVTAPTTSAVPAKSPATVAAGQRMTREQAEAFQTAMPPPVVSGTGTKTHGRWLDENGQAHEIVSGRDEDAADAWRILQERGIPVTAETTTVADVEQKLAARMVAEGRTHLDVSLNNRPCRGPFGCDTLVPVILPEGYSMTVHAPNYRKTFTGGAKPW